MKEKYKPDKSLDSSLTGLKNGKSNRIKSTLLFFKELNKPHIIRSSAIVSLTKLFSSILNLVFMVYSVNLMTKVENGNFQFYMGFLPIILALAEFGLPSALVKFIAPYIEDKKVIGNVLSSALILKLISFVILVIFAVIAWFIFKENYLLLLLLVGGGLFISFISFFESIFIAFRDYISLSIWTPFTNLLRLVVLFFASQYSEQHLTYIDIIAIFSLTPAFVFMIFFVIFDYRRLYWRPQVDKLASTTTELALFNTWAFLATIFAIISDRLEIFFINKYQSSETIAAYGTALQLFSGFVIIFSTINSLIYPKMSRITDHTEFKRFILKSVLFGFGLAVLLSPGFFLAEPILNLLFGGKYSESITIFKILYPNYLLQIVFAPLGIALFALGQPRILAVLAFLRLFSGVILDNILIPEFAATGAAISFFLGQLVSWLLLVGYFLAFFRK